MPRFLVAPFLAVILIVSAAQTTAVPVQPQHLAAAYSRSARILTRVRALQVTRTRSGFVIRGQIEVTNGCMRALFFRKGQASYQVVEQHKPGLPSSVFCSHIDLYVPTVLSVRDFHSPSEIQVTARSYVLEIP